MRYQILFIFIDGEKRSSFEYHKSMRDMLMKRQNRKTHNTAQSRKGRNNVIHFLKMMNTVTIMVLILLPPVRKAISQYTRY